MKRMLSLLLSLLLLGVSAGVTAAQTNDAAPGTVSFTVLDSGDQVLNQVENAAWKIELASGFDASERQFTLHIYSVAGDFLEDYISFRDIPVDLEVGMYSVAPTRGPADLYANARIGGFPVNPHGTLTVEAVDAETGTFSGSFSLQVYQAGSDEVSITIAGTLTDLPIIPLGTCQTSGTNAGDSFTFRVDGSAAIESFELPPHEGAWIMGTRSTLVEGGSPYLDLALQDRVDSTNGLRLEISRIPLDNPAGTYSADPEDEQGLVVSLDNRGAFQLGLADEGTITLTVDEENGTLSGELSARIPALDGTPEAVITGSFNGLPLPTQLCDVQNYPEPHPDREAA